MGKEIERKFLLANDGWRTRIGRSVIMRQGYLSSVPDCSVRVRLEGAHAKLNIKSATLGIERLEFEYAIPVVDAQAMLESLCAGRALSKTRHFVEWAGHTWEIDEFEDDNAGLVVAEIELQSAGEAFEHPPWLGAEVSEDVRYYNVRLIEHPYKDW